MKKQSTKHECKRKKQYNGVMKITGNLHYLLNQIKRYRINGIFTKTFLFVMGLVTVLMVANGVNFYIKLTDTVEKEVTTHNISSLYRIKDVCDNIFKSAETLATNIVVQDNVLFYTITDEHALLDRYEQSISRLTKMYTLVQNYLESIYVYSKTADRIVTNREASRLADFNDKNWMGTTDKSEKSNISIISRKKENMFPFLISLVRPITYGEVIKSEINSDRVTGAVIVNINAKILGEILNSNDNPNTENLVILNEKNEVLYCTDYTKIGMNAEDVNEIKGFYMEEDGYSKKMDIDGTSTVISVLNSRDYNMKYISYLPAAHYSEMFGQSVRYTLGGLIFALLGGTLATFVITYKTYMPILKITRIFNENEQKEELYDSRQIKVGNEELQFIVENISSSIVLNKEMEQELSERLALLKKATFSTLQAQINPHFLYNTLENINWLAVKLTDSDNEVSSSILTLAKLLRYGLNTDGYLVTIGDEIKQAKLYIELLKIRYPDIFTVEWDFDDTIMQYKTICLCLQPLIENAVQHGIRPMQNFGTINVDGRFNDGELLIRVSDDGVGMSEEEITMLNRQLLERYLIDSSHIGIKNVNQRIKLVFGDKYGLSVKKPYNKQGLVVEIRLSAVDKDFDLFL